MADAAELSGSVRQATTEDGAVTASERVEAYVRGKPGTLDLTFGKGGYWDLLALHTLSSKRAIISTSC
jgi:hypothetical protein